jgi:hypothetical protein
MHTENSFFIIIGVQFRANEHGSFVQKSKSGIKHDGTNGITAEIGAT